MRWRKNPPTPCSRTLFCSDEWEQVLQASGVTTREEYLRVPRTTRAGIWPVFEEYRARLAEMEVMELADCYRAAAALLEEERPGANYAAVVVDEAQDLGSPAWRLVRAIVPRGKDDLFIVGDAHQRIYSRDRVVLARCGIDIRGRGRKLRLNYRTTEETRRWADGLLARREIDDLDGGTDDHRGIRSLAHGPVPRLVSFEKREEQAVWLVDYLTELLARDEPLRGVYAGIRVELLERDSPDAASKDVRVATMHRVKGLEFDRVVIASVNDGAVPREPGSPERAAAETAERALLYVAATRAKEELTVLSFGAPSPFLS